MRREKGPDLSPGEFHCAETGTGGGPSKDREGAAGDVGRERKWTFLEQVVNSTKGCKEALTEQPHQEILECLEREVGEDLRGSKETMNLQPLSLAVQVCARG